MEPTNFFSGLQQLGCLSGLNLNLIITQTGDDTISVSVLPQMKVADAVKDQMNPMLLKGSFADLDEAFFATIAQPLAQSQGLATELSHYEASLKKAEAQNAKAKKEKEEREKKKKKADELLKQAQSLADEKKGNEALRVCQQAVDLLPDYAKATQQLEAIRKQIGVHPQADLFASPKAKECPEPALPDSEAETSGGMPSEPPQPAFPSPPADQAAIQPDWLSEEDAPAAESSPLNTPASYYR